MRSGRVYSSQGVCLPSGRMWVLVIIVAVFLFASDNGVRAVRSPVRDGKGVTRTAYACEDEKLILECQRGEVIRIINANYGRFTISVCNQYGQTEGLNLQCRFPNSKDVISERCDGRQTCVMMVNNHVFGDPCPLTSKYAEVKYNCQLAPTETNPRITTTTTSNIRQDPDGPRHYLLEETSDKAPEPPVITYAQAISPTEIKMTWMQTKPESPIITTVVYYKDKDLSHDPKAFYSSLENSVILKNLRPNAVFDIFVKSYNIFGPSDASDVIRVTTPAIEPPMSIYIKVRGSQAVEHQRSKAMENRKTLPPSTESTNPTDVTRYTALQQNVSLNKNVAENNKTGVKQSMTTNQYYTKPVYSPTYYSKPEDISTFPNYQSEVSKIDNNTTTSSSKASISNYSTNVTFSRNDTHAGLRPYVSHILIKESMKSQLKPQTTKELEAENTTLMKSFMPNKNSNSRENVSFFTKADAGKKNNSNNLGMSANLISSSRPIQGLEPTTTTTTTAEPTTPTEISTPKLSASTNTTTTSTAVTKPTARPQPPTDEKDKDNIETDPSDKKQKGNRRFCTEREVRGVIWPRTRHGRIQERECPKPLIGWSTWVCLRNGWDKHGPDYSQCTSRWLQPLEQQIQDVLENNGDAEEAVISLGAMVEEKEMSGGDLNRMATKLLPKLSKEMIRDKPFENKLQRKRRLRKFKKEFMKTSSQLLAPRHARAWHRLTRRECRKAATSLMFSIESTGFQTAAMMPVGSSDVTIDENIIMEVNVLGQQQIEKDVHFPSLSDLQNTKWKGLKDNIVIPSSSLKMETQKDPVNIVFAIYKNMAELMEPESSTVTSPSTSPDAGNTISVGEDEDGADTGPKVIINSNIISASVNSPRSHWTLPEPITFTLHHLQETKEASPMCSFWSMDDSTSSGSWSQEGCQVLESNSTHTTCECDHLTNFAVLMDVSGNEMSEDHELALRVITYVGCVVSIICLMLSWITFMVFKNLQCDRNTIHKNLVFCLMLAEIIFLAGIAQTEPKLLCSIIAGLLHYFFLAAFAWMCLEGVQLYVMLIEVFELEKSRVKWYYLFGYGVPLIIVAVSAGIKHEGYGTLKHCWLSNDNYFMWSFVGPALIVIMINLGMLSIAICTMCRHSNVSATMKERSKVAKFNVSESYSSMETFAPAKLRFPELPAWVKGAVVLVVLLGLTWILGVFYLNQESLFMAYTFTILNSLQGLFIFVFHCLMNEKVQKEYRKVARRTSWLPNCVRVNYGGYAGVSSSPNGSSGGSGNYFSRLFGTRKRKQSATSTHSSTKPFLNKDQHRRRSDTTENSSSRDSSTIPSSLNGYIYTPHYNGNNHHAVIPYNNNGGLHKPGHNGHYALEPCYETVGEGIAGELSEYIDCSVVDTEMVSEYCKNNFQVCQEQRRYSTGSENSGYEVPQEVMNMPPQSQKEPDNLSTLSCASSSLKFPASSFVSTSDFGTRSDLDISGVRQEEEEDDQQRLDLHLDKYIIPDERKNENGLPSDQKSSSMNKLAKPTVPLAGVSPDEENSNSPHHSSSPNIEYRPVLSTFFYPAAPPITHPNTTYQRQMVDSPSEASNTGSQKSSLPDIPAEVDGDVKNSKEDSQQKGRPSSEADLHFSPFRFSNSDC